MSEATEKQISFATSLGIQEPASKSKETLKVLIDEALKAKGGNEKNPQPQPSIGQIGATQGISEVTHLFQSSYEFGPAGNRHTIKYYTIEELKEKIRLLEESGLMSYEIEKIQ